MRLVVRVLGIVVVADDGCAYRWYRQCWVCAFRFRSVLLFFEDEVRGVSDFSRMLVNVNDVMVVVLRILGDRADFYGLYEQFYRPVDDFQRDSRDVMVSNDLVYYVRESNEYQCGRTIDQGAIYRRNLGHFCPRLNGVHSVVYGRSSVIAEERRELTCRINEVPLRRRLLA